jgi:hypothetical protein
LTGSPAPGSATEVETANKSQAYAYNIAATTLQSAVDHLGLAKAGRSGTRADVCPPVIAEDCLRVGSPCVLAVRARHRRSRSACQGHCSAGRGVRRATKVRRVVGPNHSAGRRQAGCRQAGRLDECGCSARIHSGQQEGRPGAHDRRPRSRRAVRSIRTRCSPAKGQWRYWLYSGYAHAKQWALTLGAEQVGPFDASGQTIAIAQAEDSITVDATERCIAAVDRTISAYEQ